MRHNKKLQPQVVRFFAALIVALPAAWVIAALNQLFARLTGGQPSFQPDALSFLGALIGVFALAWLAQWIAATAMTAKAAPAAAAATHRQPPRQPARASSKDINDDEDDEDDEEDDENILDLATAEDGEVKWFSRDRGYGFVVRSNGEEVFVHFRAIRGRGRRKFLQEGQRVRFNIVNGENGKPKAINVMLVE